MDRDLLSELDFSLTHTHTYNRLKQYLCLTVGRGALSTRHYRRGIIDGRGALSTRHYRRGIETSMLCTILSRHYRRSWSIIDEALSTRHYRRGIIDGRGAKLEHDDRRRMDGTIFVDLALGAQVLVGILTGGVTQRQDRVVLAIEAYRLL